jgi:cell division protein FtsZ
LDFADVKTIMSNQGTALMGIGVAKGEGRAVEAAKKAISSPLLETSIDGAQGILMNITGGKDLSLYEVQEAADLVASAADKELNMIFGSIINEDFKNEIMITVIATGFEEKQLRTTNSSAQSSKDRTQINSQPRHEHSRHEHSRHEQVRHEEPVHETDGPYGQESEESLDIPTFLRNRNKRNR